MDQFHRLLSQSSLHVHLNWEVIPPGRVIQYLNLGCRKGDAVIAASAETLAADLIVSNNRQFLQTLSALPVGIATPAQALARLSVIDVK